MFEPFVTRLRAIALADLFREVTQWRTPAFWIALLCFVLIFPVITLRGAHYEEGTVIGLARGAFEDGHWFEHHLYGNRFMERPALFSLLLGVVGLLTKSIPDWLARVPVALALVAGAYLVYGLVRAYASVAAALFGAMCFSACPLVLQKLVTAEPDLLVGVTMFAAFVVLWRGEEQGGVGAGRWLAVGAILAVAALIKGPQQVAFFFLGVGSFYLLRRRWIDFVKLALAGLVPAAVTAGWYWAAYRPGDIEDWARHSRLVAPPLGEWILSVLEVGASTAIQLLPGWRLAVPLAAPAIVRPQSKADDLIAVLILYAGIGTAILLLWPFARTRYAMPAVPALAVVAGLAFDRLREDKTRLLNNMLVLVAVFALVRILLNWIIIPLAPDAFARSRFYGHAIAEMMALQPAPLYFTQVRDPLNMLVYVPYRVREASIAAVAVAEPPFWAMVLPEQEQILRTARPDLQITRRLAPAPGRWYLLEVRKD